MKVSFLTQVSFVDKAFFHGLTVSSRLTDKHILCDANVLLLQYEPPILEVQGSIFELKTQQGLDVLNGLIFLKKRGFRLDDLTEENVVISDGFSAKLCDMHEALVDVSLDKRALVSA